MAKCSTEDLMNDPQYDEQAEESRRRSLAKIALMEAFDRGHMMDFLGSWAVSDLEHSDDMDNRCGLFDSGNIFQPSTHSSRNSPNTSRRFALGDCKPGPAITRRSPSQLRSDTGSTVI